MIKIAILGAGPAGLALAFKLLRENKAAFAVTLVDRRPEVGGMAAGFRSHGLVFDYGSHRLHPAADPEILADLAALPEAELAIRPRNGRIRLMGRYVRFPLGLTDSLRHLPPAFMAGVAFDMLRKLFARRSGEPGNFADFLLAGLGPTICRNFYFPYAEKLWGLKPEEISVDHARRRVSQDTVAKIAGKIFKTVPGLRKKGAGTFLYPRNGFGRICEALENDIEQNGGQFRLSAEIETIRRKADGRFEIRTAPESEPLAADYVFATIPIPDLVRSVRPKPGPEVAAAAAALPYRGLVLCYLILGTNRFTPFDAHYFPEKDVLFSRISEPRNYRNGLETGGKTGLCVEIPCRVGDETWQASDRDLSERVGAGLRQCGLPLKAPVIAAFTRRLPRAYPVYARSYARHLRVVDDFFNGLPHLIRYGRQALFIHDNLHHAMAMGYAAARCLAADGTWNGTLWRDYIRKFATFTVED